MSLEEDHLQAGWIGYGEAFGDIITIGDGIEGGKMNYILHGVRESERGLPSTKLPLVMETSVSTGEALARRTRWVGAARSGLIGVWMATFGSYVCICLSWLGRRELHTKTGNGGKVGKKQKAKLNNAGRTSRPKPHTPIPE